MLAQIFSLLALAVSATLAAPTAPTSLDQRAVARRSLSGQATFYGGNVHGGTCSFSTYTLPSGLYGTALSDSNWDDAGNCGGCVAVTYGGKTVTAMVRLIFGCPSPVKDARLTVCSDRRRVSRLRHEPPRSLPHGFLSAR